MTVISDAKRKALAERMKALSIDESQLTERFIKGSGSGGQKINKTASCVYLLHQPSGVEVKCQRSRSQSANRFFARRDLCDHLEQKQLGAASSQQIARDKIRKQKQRRKRRSKTTV